MKKFKRLISCLLTIVLLLSQTSIQIFAADGEKSEGKNNKTVISVESKNAIPGGKVDVNVLIKNNPGILGGTLEFTFDKSLTLVKASNGETFSYLTMTKPGKFNSPCRFIWDGQECKDENIKDGISGLGVTTGYSKYNAFAIWGAYVKKAWEWNWSLAKNLGKPGGILSTEGYVDKEDRKEISDKYTASNGGANHAGKTLVLGSGLKYKDTSRATIDTDWCPGEQKAYERTAIAAGVPAELVGGGESTYQN